MKMWTVIGLCLAVWFNFSNAMVCFPEHVQTKFCNADFVVRVKITSTVKTDIPDLPTTPNNRGNGHGNGRNNNNNNSNRPLKEIDPIRGRHSGSEPRRFARSLGMGPAGFGYGIARRFTQYLDVKIKRILRGGELVNKTEGTTPEDNTSNTDYGRMYVMDPFVGRQLKPNKAYLLAGKIINKKMWVSACSWHKEWAQLGLDQLRGLKKEYRRGCRAHCRVQMCFYEGCEEHNKRLDVCMWKPDDWSPVDGTDNDCKVKHSACRKIDGRCQWKHSERFFKCKKNKAKNFP